MKKPNPIPNNKPFPKGVSGNPSGRPVGIPNSATVIRKWLDVKGKLFNQVTGKDVVMTHYDAVVLCQIAKALKSDTTAFNALMDRLEGKPMQRIEAEIETQNISVDVPAKQREAILKSFRDDF